MRCRYTTPPKCKVPEQAKSRRIARNPTVQMHPGHRRDKRSSWEQAVSMSSAQEAARSGSPPVADSKNDSFNRNTQSAPMGRGKVAAALKRPVITPWGMAEWRRAAAAPRRRPTMNKSPRKICLGTAFRKST
ncbi:hypothetical protein T484DRAFT_1747478 [Baffinella frigidus]|nr:hypothetical protein T484DRAFT_1747478 [Cryptophyta sp. CCMP2293]